MIANKLPVAWRKSSYSTNGGDCIEIGEGLADVIPVRDSKDANGPVLAFKRATWAAFISHVKVVT
ncbi:DUF397 domain-containing protein [Streptomyces olivoreticuli]|uniref:DUF397 domain-containing protein n=1 Tax=Streptomyces olivoreticuli TaxID=68246 RepID=UPI00265A82FF|nr:DUF397 domain-containing protein [Streptomyces olivoreticuli]WKK25160.1 DUF397 domain-containing protein [Streptomyces olivoreticuli]